MRRLLIAAVVLAACGDSTGPGSVAGAYCLRSVNGQPVPIVNDQSIFGGVIRLHASGAYVDTLYGSFAAQPMCGDLLRPLSGTFSRDGSAVTFSANSVEGHLRGDSLFVPIGSTMGAYVRSTSVCPGRCP